MLAKHVLLMWDEFGAQNGPMKVFLLPCKTQEQFDRLIAHQGKYINSEHLDETDPVHALSDHIYNGKLDKYKQEWPVNLRVQAVVVHSGFLP
jgi:hypothetical protein